MLLWLWQGKPRQMSSRYLPAAIRLSLHTSGTLAARESSGGAAPARGRHRAKITINKVLNISNEWKVAAEHQYLGATVDRFYL